MVFQSNYAKKEGVGKRAKSLVRQDMEIVLDVCLSVSFGLGPQFSSDRGET